MNVLSSVAVMAPRDRGDLALAGHACGSGAGARRISARSRRHHTDGGPAPGARGLDKTTADLGEPCATPTS